MHNSKRIIDVHILESISEDRTRVAQYFIYILLSSNTIQTILSPFIFFFFEKYFYLREMFVSGSYRQFIDSVSGIKRKGRDEKIEDGCCLDHRLFDF